MHEIQQKHLKAVIFWGNSFISKYFTWGNQGIHYYRLGHRKLDIIQYKHNDTETKTSPT